MPTLVDLLARVSFLAAMPAVAGILITAGLLVVSQDWRVSVTALAVQYFFMVLLLTRQIRLEVAAVKGVIGWVICVVLYLTEQRVSAFKRSSVDQDVEDAAPSQRWRRWVMSAQASFYLLAVILIAVVAYMAALRIPLPEVPADITLVCYLLTGLGLLLLALSDAPLRVGLGLLTFLSGFDLFYVTLVPSLAVAGLLGLLSFVIVLATAYLSTAQIATGTEEETT